MKQLESQWLVKCNEVARTNGLPTGAFVERIYYAAESGALRLVVAGNRYEAVQGSDTGEVFWKP